MEEVEDNKLPQPGQKHVLSPPPFLHLSLSLRVICDSFVLVFLQAKPRLQREGSCASLHNSLMRNSIFQLMIHTLDPLSDESKTHLFLR